MEKNKHELPYRTSNKWLLRPRFAFAIAIILSLGNFLLLATDISLAGNVIGQKVVQMGKPEPTPKIVVPRKTGVDKVPTGVQASTAPAEQSPAVLRETQQLQKILQSFVASQPTQFGIYVKDLKNNALAEVNSDQVFPSASLYKLYVADLIFHQIDIKKLRLSSSVGSTGHNVHECLDLMITISDNDCGRGLGDITQWNLSNSIITDRGYTHSNLNDPPTTSAGDTGKLLEHLYQQLDEASNNDQLVFLELLKHQHINDRLSLGLPPNTVIAHKTGNIDDYVHDVGIIYGPKTSYIISVLSGPWGSPGDAPTAFANLSQQIYQQLEQ